MGGLTAEQLERKKRMTLNESTSNLTPEQQKRRDEMGLPEPAAATNDPDWLDKTRHVVAGGLTDFVTGISDAPYNLRELAEQGAELATGKEEGEVDFRLPKALRDTIGIGYLLWCQFTVVEIGLHKLQDSTK